MPKQKEEIKKVNQSLGLNASIGIFTGFQFAVSLFAFGIGFISAFIFNIGMIWSLLAGLWLSASVVVLSGKRPYLFWSKIFPGVPTWTRGYVKYSNPLHKNKVGSRKRPKSW